MELGIRIVFSIIVFFGWIFLSIYGIIYGLFTTPPIPLPRPKRPEILNLSATTLAQKIRTQKLTSEQVVAAFIERCEQVNGQLNAIIEDRFVEALEEAKNVDQLIRSNVKTAQELELETPLLGVPITVKECCMVKGSSYTLGSKLRKGVRASEDGDAVACLRNAGAIPIAVTNNPELASSIETCNDTIGYTCNPYNFNYSAGGSSGGEGSLISAGGSVLGLGSDFGGSIRIPCLFNGLFGHKPTSGIVSNRGHFPNASSEHFQKMLTLGPICRYAEDLKLAMTIISGSNVHLLKLDQTVDLNKLKIYYTRDRGFILSKMSVHECIQGSIFKAIEHFQTVRQCYIQEIDLPELDDIQEICSAQALEIEGAEKMLCLKEPKAEHSLAVELLKGIMKKSDYSKEVLQFRLGAHLLFYFMPKNKRPKYITIRNSLIERLKEILHDNGVFFFPTFATTAHYKNLSFWTFSGIWYAMIANVLGFPATHVTMGLNKDGLPTGFQVIAAPNQDRLCLAVAEELEKRFGGWVSPS